jgi:hypothetical protein
MRPIVAVFFFTFFVVAIPVLVLAEEAVDLQMVMRIRDEGFANSNVMETAGYLCDVIGPRLTASPNLKKAHDWTRQQLESWGLANVHLESWGPFGRGWSVQHVSVHLLSPDPTPLIAYPRAWTPGTQGPVRGKLVQAKITTESDFEKFKGKLAGLIVLPEALRELKVHDKADFSRYTEQQLEELKLFSISRPRRDPPPPSREEYLKLQKFLKAYSQFLLDEKVLAVIEPALGDGGIVRNLRGTAYKPGETFSVPSLMIESDHYNRLIRLLEKKLEPELEMDVRVSFYDEDLMGYNTVADIPGSDKKDEIVMLGGHLDSWHLGTGATDDAAGVSVAMEAVRILKALGIKPRRTIRLGLWGGEEQGLLGSHAYVTKHFAAFAEPKDPEEKSLPAFLRREEGPLEFKPDYAKLSAYFNLDNGGGKIRGIYTQNNLSADILFESWLKPLADLGAKTVTNQNTSGTDHLSFSSVGLPGFQFIQDEVEYGSRTWHTNMDVYDRLQSEDLMQASVVMASFVYQAAMRDALFPRRPLPDKWIKKAGPSK